MPVGTSFKDKNGIKLEKNSVIKMGRVRLRVRDIDYSTKQSKVPEKDKDGIAVLNEIEKLDVALNHDGGRSSRSPAKKEARRL